METPMEEAQVDFRFADAEDAAEILALVNSAFSVEKGDSILSFTKSDRVTEEEVEACLQGVGGEKRWLVLETPRPEECMVAACLICTVTDTPGTGYVEMLAVDPARQGEGLGSQMLRRAEGILLNFRCRFVRMRIPQWREDVLGWAAKRGYKETGGGCGRDLLTDGKVASTFGDGTARFTAATAAAVQRAAVSSDTRKPVSDHSSCEVSWGVAGGPAKGREDGDGDETKRLAGFLSSVLKGLADAEEEDRGGKSADAAPLADDAVGTMRSPRSSTPVPPIAASNTIAPTHEEVGEARSENACSTGVPAEVLDGSSFSSPVDDDFEVTELPCVVEQATISPAGNEEDVSVETLLGSLMRTLNTEKGRADFRALAATGSRS